MRDKQTNGGQPTESRRHVNGHHNGAGASEAHTIAEALALLDAAAQRGSEEVKSMLANDFEALKRTVAEVTPQIQEAIVGIGRGGLNMAKSTKEQAIATTRDAARAVDRSAHQNAWFYIAGAALVGVACGFFLSHAAKPNPLSDE